MKGGEKMKFENVIHVTKTVNVEVVNKLLATGWIIIETYEPRKDEVVFALGLLKDSHTVSDTVGVQSHAR